MTVSLAISSAALAEGGPSRPNPNHPPPAKPNPTKPISQPIHPKPTMPIPVIKPPQHPKPGTHAGINPTAPVFDHNPKKTVTYNQPSYLQNKWTKGNRNSAQGKVDEAKQHHGDHLQHVHEVAHEYVGLYKDEWKERGEWFRRYHDDDHYRRSCSRLFDHGFYGGYFYPVNECNNVEIYFDYPTVEWFYSGEVDYDYYTACYGDDDYNDYPVTVFPYASVYYPTQTLMDLLVDVAGLPAFEQSNFRQGVVNITNQLQQEISDFLQLDYVFQANQIVVTHYENLNNQLYVIEGFVDGDQVNVPFKAIVDVEDPSDSAVFAAFNTDPQTADLTVLNWINDRIVQFGGDPLTADIEPDLGQTTPVTPVDPNQPVTPVTPVDPNQPVTPVTPVDPNQPVTPVTPVDPNQPVTPVTPVDPNQPVTPVTPVDPNQPVTPVTPVTPVDPNQPVTPVTPVTPVDPNAPACASQQAAPAEIAITVGVNDDFQNAELLYRQVGTDQWQSLGVAGTSNHLTTPALDPCKTDLAYEFELKWTDENGDQVNTLPTSVAVSSGAQVSVSVP
jgi:hypothetical protein